MTVATGQRVIKTILTHIKMHLDEYMAIWLLIRFGGKFFSGIDKAEIVSHNNGNVPERDDVIAVGTGGGPFDEHAFGKSPAKEGECSATLVAKHLGIKSPGLPKLLKYALRNDTRLGDDEFGLAYLVKLLHRKHPRGVKKVAEWVNLALDALYAKYSEELELTHEDFFQGVVEKWLKEHSSEADAMSNIVAYFQKHKSGKVSGYTSLARLANLVVANNPNAPKKVETWLRMALEAKLLEQKEFIAAGEDVEKAKLLEIRRPNQTIRIIYGKSDSTAFNASARSLRKADVVVQEFSTGHIRIFTRQINRKPVVSLKDVMAVLRIMEQRKKSRMITTDWEDLRKGGSVSGAEEWYYLKPAEMPLNGSETAPDVPPTKLALREVMSALRIGLGQSFNPTKEEECLKGNCSSEKDKVCPWYP